MRKVFIIGGTTFDHIIAIDSFPQAEPQTIHQINSLIEGSGSTGAGKALSLYKLGVPVTLYSVLGDDYYGDFIIKYLNTRGVNFIFDIDPAGTERHVNIMNGLGERISIFITQSSEHLKMDMARIKEAIQTSDIVVLNIIAYCKDLIPTVKGYNKPVWTDLHDYEDGNPYHEPFIEAADYLFLSSDNLADYRKTMLELMERDKELVVCTHGAKGSTALTKAGEWIDIPAIPSINLVDTNGAGDNYFSGFLYAYLRGYTISTAMKYGTICGAECITSTQLVAETLTSDYIEKKFKELYKN